MGIVGKTPAKQRLKSVGFLLLLLSVLCTTGSGVTLQTPEISEGVAWLNLDYVGDGETGHQMDLFLPARGNGPFPVVVYVYGSAWFSNNGKGSASRIKPALNEAGFAVAAINHRSSREAIFPAQIQDVKAAIRFIRANSETYNLDPERIGITGASSGGHLAALTGTSGGVRSHTIGQTSVDLEGSLGNHLDQSSAVRAVCDWYGPTDFLVMNSCGSEMDHDAPESPESVLVGGPIQDKQEMCRLANPTTYLDAGDPPFLIIHGDMDPLVPFCQSDHLHRELTRAGVSSEYILVKGAGHGGRLLEPDYYDAMVQFFLRTL